MNKTKTEQLDELFKDWKQELNKSKNFNLYNDIFIKDGIVDCDTFESQDIKVLFISNEANIGDEFNPKDDDIRNDFKIYNKRKKDEYYNVEKKKWETSKGKMRERVCCLYQVIVNDYTEKGSPFEVFDRFAFMNLNKTGGGSEIDHKIISFCEEFKKEIKREIDIISPDLIVWLGCNTFDIKGIRKGIGVKTCQGKYYYNDIPVIRMWHTSYFRSKYEKLGKFDNEIIDKLAAKLHTELENIDWYNGK